MRHKNYKYRIGTSTTHRKAILKNLAIDILKYGKIKTTITKCKAVKPFIEKLITLAKEDTTQKRRLAFSKLNNKYGVKSLFNVAIKFKERPGGYTRITRIPDRRVGDGATCAYISLVEWVIGIVSITSFSLRWFNSIFIVPFISLINDLDTLRPKFLGIIVLLNE